MNRFYSAYRKIKFLWKKGSFFNISSHPGHCKSTYPKGTFTVIFFNSTLLFLLAYLLISTVTKIATGISAYAFDIKTVLYYYNIDYLIKGTDWFTDAVQVIFSTAPMTSFIFGILLLVIYVKVMAETGILRLLILWMMAHSIVFFLGDIFTGAIFNQGFGYVIIYFFFMDTGKMIICFITLLAMITLGLFLTRIFLFSGNIYFNMLNSVNRTKFIWNQIIYPFFAGNLIIALFKIPNITIYEVCTNATMLFILIPVAIRGKNMQDLYFDEDPRTIKFSGLIAGITFFLLISYRIAFGIGIRL
ncbi:MAG: hypothetical protein M0P47_03580 [Bacteroidales bacterium]|nr:hypothetical protein [Bacteroidales bacterium]